MPELVAYRVASWDTPLRVNSHRTGGRYHSPGSPATQYFSTHPFTPWAEYLRRHGLTEPADIEPLRLRVWAIRVIVPELEPIGFANAKDWGIEAEDLISDDHTACRALGERMRRDRGMSDAIKVPSAALPGTRNIVIFGERVEIPYLWEPIDDGDLPVARVAERARPPEGLERLVRHSGKAHDEFEAWRKGQRYVFSDEA